MTRQKISRHEVARSAATDTANRAMRSEGRTVWSAEDYAAAVREYNRLNPVEAQ